MAYKPIQLICKHSPNCAMLNGLNGDQPWCSPIEVNDSTRYSHPHVGRDLTGRKNPKAGHSWMLFICSDPDCPAQLAIYWPKAEQMLGLSYDAWKAKEGK